MLLKADNRVLTRDQPKTILTASVAATGTTLTVANNGGFSQNDYVLIGRIGEEKAEIKRISASVTAGTSLTVVACTFAHDIDTPVTKLDYDQVEYSHASTATGSKSVLTTINVEPTEIFTYYEDTTNTTGFGFIRYKDSNASTFSIYSDAVPYTGYTGFMLRSIRKKIRRLLNEPDESIITDADINDEINLAQKEIAHDRLWSFYEKTASFSSVANQYEYTLATDVFRPYFALYDTQPLAIIDMQRWNNLRWNTDVTGDPTHITLWRKKARVYPYPSTAATTTAINDATDITATDTSVTVDSTSGFKEQGRILIDSEVISYTGITTTSFTGLTRAEEGTTAAAHLDDATITERDFIYYFQEEPTDLDDETDTTDIPEPSVITYKAAAELALQKDDEVLHDRLLAKFERAMVQLRKVDQPKIKGSFGRVKNWEEVVSDHSVLKDPNTPPQNVNQ